MLDQIRKYRYQVDWKDESHLMTFHPSGSVHDHENEPLIEKDHPYTDPEWHLGKKSSRGGHTRRLPRGEAIEEACLDVFASQRRQVLNKFKGFWRKAFEWPMIDLSGWDEVLAKKATPGIEIAWEQGSKEVIARLGVAVKEKMHNFNVTNPKVKNSIKHAALKFAKSTNETTSLKLRDAIHALRHELEEGLFGENNTVPEMTKRVNQIFDQAEAWRARRIAFTESSRALHDGQKMSAIESGVVSRVTWILSDDACPICKGIAAAHPDGIPLTQDGTFGTFGDNPDYKDIEMAPAHPNCMCTNGEIIDEKALQGVEKEFVKSLKKEEGGEGRWITVNGHHVLIKDDEGTTGQENSNEPPKSSQLYEHEHKDWMEHLSKDEHVAIVHWKGNSSDFRALQASPDTWQAPNGSSFTKEEFVKRLNNINSAVNRAPKFQGTMYRGMRVPEATAERYLKVGAEYNLKANASFTRSKEIGVEYGGKMLKSGVVGLTFQVESRKYGVDIQNVGGKFHREQEVIASMGAKYKVESFEKIRDRGGKVQWLIKMKEE